jgi:hypothetical protein
MGERSQAPDRRTGPGQQVTRLESTWFLVCVGLIAVHVVDDRFLQPEQGISAGDHLVSGFVPLLLLLAAALGYHRMRAGWRALTALAVGSFGLGTGAEAAYYTFTVGASGDDYTSWLTAPAAFGLLGLSAVVAWRSRKRDDSSTVRLVLRRLGLSIGVVALVFLALQPLTESYVLTHVITAEVPEPDFGHDYEDVTFTTDDGLRLRGWYVPSENGAAVIVFPGRTGRDDHVRMLADHGYGVLVFDRRGEGVSDGEPNLLGWGGDEDLKAAAEYLASRPDVEPGRIGGIGLSVGGELLIEAAAEADAFAAIVSEGAGARSIRDVLDRPGTPGLLDLWIWSLVTPAAAVLTDRLPPRSVRDLVDEVSPTALLLVYGEQGQPQEISMNPDFYEAAGEPKELWEVPESAHIDGIDAQPEEYEQRLIEFFDRYLAAE